MASEQAIWPIVDLTIESGLFVPTVWTSSGGLMKPKSWGELTGLLIFDYCPYSQVWTYAQYSDSINDDNYFGLSAVAGTARTVQDSYSTISGATVRTSGESTSYQRALVAAAILAGSDVVKGRF